MEFEVFQQVRQMSIKEQENVLAQAAVIMAGGFVGPADDMLFSAMRLLASVHNPRKDGYTGSRCAIDALKSWMAHLRMLTGVCKALEHPYNQLLERLEGKDG